MSSEIDNRIVKLSFDNKQFEEGVSKSMSTLDKLEEKLQFKKSAKGLSALQVGIDGVNFDELAKKIEKIEGRLSAFGIAGATVIQDITKTLINGAKKIEEATIGQITSGGWSRAMNLENAKFTVEGLGLEWQEMLKAINYGVQDTAYGLDAAATAASQLAASGVSYQESIDGANDSLMHTSLRAISGVAAMTNSSYEDISRIFASVAGQGALMGDQLMQLAARGLNAAAIMGEALGMSEADIRDMASARMIDFETFATIMDQAFGEHAKEANKTFNGALSNMKAALSRFGAVFATPVVQNTNRFFIALTDRIKELKTMISDVTEAGQVLYEGLESHFAQMWSALIDMMSAITEAANLDWFQSIANAADNTAVKLRDIFEAVTQVWTGAEEEVEKTKDYSTITEQEMELVSKVLNGAFGSGATRAKKLTEAVKELNKQIDMDNRARENAGFTSFMENVKAEDIQEYVNIIAQYGYSVEKAGIEVKKFKETTEEVEEEIDPFQQLIDMMKKMRKAAEWLSISFSRAWDSFTEVISYITAGMSSGPMWDFIVDQWVELAKQILYFSTIIHFTSDELEWFYSLGQDIGAFVQNVILEIVESATWLVTLVKDIFKYWRDSGELVITLKNIDTIVGSLTRAFVNVLTIVRAFGQAVVTAFFRVFSPSEYTGRLASFAKIIEGVTGALIPSEEVIMSLTDALTSLFQLIHNVKSFIRSIAHTIGSVIAGMAGFGQETEETEDRVSILTFVIGGLLTVISKVINLVSLIPGLLQAVFAQLKDDKRIEHLTNSFKDLAEHVKETEIFDKISNWLADIGDKAESIDVVNLIADAIGNMAEGIAKFVDKLPGWMDNIEKFFKDFKEVWQTFVTPLTGGENEKSRNQMTDPQKFAEQLGQDLRNFFTSLDLKSLLSGGVETASILVLLKLTHLLDIATQLFWIMDSIGYAVFRVVWKFGTILTAVRRFVNALAFTSIISAMAIGVTAIASAIALIAQIPEDKLQRAITSIGAVLVAMMAMFEIYFKYKQWIFQAYGITAIKVREIALLNNLIDTIGSVLMVLAFGYMLVQVINSLVVLAEVINEFEGDENMIFTMAAVIAGIFTACTIFFYVMWNSIKNFRRAANGLVMAWNAQVELFIAVGLIVVSIGAVVWLMVQALKNLSDLLNGGVHPDTWLIAIGIVAMIITVPLILLGLLTKMPMTPQSGKVLLTIAGIIAIMCAGLIGIIWSLTLLVPAINLISLAGSEDLFLGVMNRMILMVLALLGGIALLIFAFTSGRSRFELTTNRKVLTTILLMVLSAVGAIFVMGLVLTMISAELIALKKVGADATVLNNIFSLMIAALIVILAGIALVIFVVGKSSLTPYMKQTLNSIAILMLAVSASLLIMAYAIKVVSEALRKGAKFGQVLTLFAIFAAIVTAVIIGSVLLAKKISSGGGMGGGIQDALFAIVGAMVGIAGALLIFAAAVWVIGEAPAEGMSRMGTACLIFAGALAALLLIVALVPGAKTAMVTLGVFFVALGAGALLAGAGALALGAAMQLVNPLLPTFAIGLKMLLDTIHSRLGTFLIVSAVFIAIAALAVFFVDKISKALTAFFQLLTALIGSIGGLLKSAGKGLMGWFRSMGPIAKVGIGILIAAVLSALSGQGPAILQTIGQLILKILDWLEEAIGPLAEKLVDIVVKLIDGLINGLYDNLDVIMALLKNFLITLFVAILKLGWELIIGGLKKVLSLIPGFEDNFEDLFGVSREDAFSEIEEFFREEMNKNTEAALAQRDALRANGSAFDKLVEETDKAAKKTKEMTDATNEANEAGGLLGTTLDSIKDKCQDYPQAAKDAMVKAGQAAFGKDGAFFSNLAENMDSHAIEDAIKKNLGAYGENGKFFTIASSSAKKDTDDAKKTYAEFPDWLKSLMGSNMIDMSAFKDQLNLGDSFDMEAFMNGEGSIDVSSLLGEDGFFDMSKFQGMMGEGGEEAGVDFFSSFAEGQTSQKDEVVSATDEVTDAQIAAINAKNEEYKTSGANSMEAVNSGVRSQRNHAVESSEFFMSGLKQPILSDLNAGSTVKNSFGWIGAMIGKALSGSYEEEMEIESPSKVMMRLGKYTLMGLKNGIVSETGNISLSMQNLSDTMIDSFGNPLDYVSKVASGELQYDPSIRPVLDTGSVTTGISAINTMLDSQNVTVSGFSGRLAADISGLDMTNNQMVTEIRALRSDMNEMTDQITNMKIVMNSGQLVGAISKDMNRVLGQDQVHRGRGM